MGSVSVSLCTLVPSKRLFKSTKQNVADTDTGSAGETVRCFTKS
jgi:hypothetical protein